MFNKLWLTKFMVVFGYFMVAVYLALGVLLFIPRFYPYIPSNIKFVFAIFFIAYGLFRLVRIISKKREPEKE